MRTCRLYTRAGTGTLVLDMTHGGNVDMCTHKGQSHDDMA